MSDFDRTAHIRAALAVSARWHAFQRAMETVSEDEDGENSPQTTSNTST